jgi:hypothetical protein
MSYACRQAGDFNDVLGLGASYFAGQVLAVTHVYTKVKPPTAAVAARYALAHHTSQAGQPYVRYALGE